MSEDVSPDPNFLRELIRAKMPYGQYKDRYIHQLPVHYLEWMARKGFPNTTLGQYLSTMYEIKLNGLERLLTPLLRGQ